jgi:plasmid stabilization system protein ParE
VIRIVWAPQAIQDVGAIRAHIARDSTYYADLVVERIVGAVEHLGDHPRSGRVVPELGDESIREVIHGNYRIHLPAATGRCRDRDGFPRSSPLSARLTVVASVRYPHNSGGEPQRVPLLREDER